MFKTILIVFVNILLANCEESSNPLTSNANFLEVIAFRKLGSYRGFAADGVEYHKTYYLSRNVWLTWAEALSFCKSYNLEFLTLDAPEEAEAYFNLVDTNAFFKTQSTAWFYVDAFAMTLNSRTDWYWSTTGQKVSFPIPWHPNHPRHQYCLCLNKESLNARFYFYDAGCNGAAGAACQKTTILSANSKK
ncbi:unnamed protein product [Chironomus riparius]|uniref:C-type lectin domain-containing protein n=1 Tax=Chironomus riparius TaxID=315576 RepID=A0A9N9RUN5_9DIPT|nr:unnamed protein product [Chironomus riparius]